MDRLQQGIRNTACSILLHQLGAQTLRQTGPTAGFYQGCPLTGSVLRALSGGGLLQGYRIGAGEWQSMHSTLPPRRRHARNPHARQVHSALLKWPWSAHTGLPEFPLLLVALVYLDLAGAGPGGKIQMRPGSGMNAAG